MPPPEKKLLADPDADKLHAIPMVRAPLDVDVHP
jgi:hypothetical protein